MNIQNLKSMEEYNRQNRVQNTAGSFGRASAAARGMNSIPLDPLGADAGVDTSRYGIADVIPVLCVNTWEHCYIHDYGVAGKRAYLASWWEHVDWEKVWSNCVQLRGFSGYVR